MAKKRILFVSTHFPSRLGGVRRLWHNLRHFSRRFEVHFLRVGLPGEKVAAGMALPHGVKFSELAAQGADFDPLFFLLAPPAWKRVLAIRSAAPQVQSYIDRHGIDAVVLHPIDTSLALRGIRARVKVAELLDSVENYYASKNSAGFGSPASLLLGLSQKLFTPWLWKECARKFDLMAFVSVLDLPREGAIRQKCIALEARDAPVVKKNVGARKHGVVIIGRWGHPPNRDGLARIAKRLGEMSGEVLLVGPNLPHGMALTPNVKALGFVDDLDALLSQAKVCLVPIWYGAGLQNKLFDALRCGCKVVSTPFTRRQMEANGFRSDAVAYADDVVAAAGKALAGWKPADAAKSYAAYAKFSAEAEAAEKEYVKRVSALASQPSP